MFLFQTTDKAIVDIRLRPRCAIPPPSRTIIDSSNACNQASAPISVHAATWTSPIRNSSDVRLVMHFFQKNTLHPLWGSSPLRNTLFYGPGPLIVPNGISIGSAVFVWVPVAMLYNALPMGKKIPKTAPFLGISSLCWRRTEPGP